MKAFLKSIVVKILQAEARLVLKKYRPKIIAVTGSAGKTGTKDAIFQAIAHTTSARKSEKSFNSELGVPLTILGQPTGWTNPLAWVRIIFDGLLLITLKRPYPAWLVLEIGTQKPGDIPAITKWLTPDAVVVTRLGEVPVHVEFFDTPEAVKKEKGALVEALREDGLLVLNADDPAVHEFAKHSKSRLITYGIKEKAALMGTHIKTIYDDGRPVGMSFKAEYDENVIPVKLSGVVGDHYVGSMLAALAVGVGLGMNIVDLANGLAGYEAPRGRSRLIRGLKETTIIDDTYNAAPAAVEAGLETLADMETKGRKIAVLGDMLELGKFTVEEHKRLGELAAKSCDILVVVGPRAQYFAEGALLGGMNEKHIHQYNNAYEAGNEVELMMKPGDIVLVKGSQGARMERIVVEIMANPEARHKLLVRQEKEWEVR